MSPLANRAILLVAGRGRRLGQLTNGRPKCLIEIAGVSILERALTSLSACKISEVVLVVGYLSDQISRVAGNVYDGMRIRYVENVRHSETNTAYSLWLARDYLDGATVLLEGDIVIDAQTLMRILTSAKNESVWATVNVGAGRDEGILLEGADRDRVRSVKLVRHPSDRDDRLTHKCGGIQVLSASMADALALKLDQLVPAGHTQLFADLVLADLIREQPMTLCCLDGSRWAEIDDPSDLVFARELFGSRSLSRRASVEA